MQKILKLINHRDFILLSAFVSGLAIGDQISFLAEYSIYVLALVMIISTTGFSFRAWQPINKALKTILIASFLNYIVFSLTLILVSWWLMPSEVLWIGFIIIAASPPGIAIIPFSAVLKGDINFSVSGVFGAHIIAMAIAPLMLIIFIGNSLINPIKILLILVQLIIVPLITSRFLRHRKIRPKVDKYRGTVVNWGFFMIIAPIVGLNREVFFSQPDILFRCSLTLLISMFGLAYLLQLILIKLKKDKPFIISAAMTLAIKSSAFSAVTALAFFGEKAALPSAVLAVFVIFFVIVFSFTTKRFLKFGNAQTRKNNNSS